jgi:transcriptional regulator with XRE-family HTH domain
MKARDLKRERLKHGWVQAEAAHRLGVSQPYVAMLEAGKRRLTADLARKATMVYGLPPVELPLPESFKPARGVGPQHLVEYLSSLDYPGFAYVRPHVPKKNPAEVLLTALAQESLEARVAEGLPWLMLHYWEMNPNWLVAQAKSFDLQNRLGFVTSLAHELSARTPETGRTRALFNLKTLLDPSRLMRVDFFPRPARNEPEREWLRQNQPDEARHWNLLTDLRREHLQYAYW